MKKECGIFDYGSRLYICLKAKDCQPANRRGRRMGVTLCVCVKTRQLVWVIAYQNIIYAEYTCLCVSARMFVCMLRFLDVSYSSVGLRRIQRPPSGCC